MRKIWVSVVGLMTFIGAYLSSRGSLNWWVTTFFGTCMVMLLLEPKLLEWQVRRRKQVLQITDRSVRRELPGGKHEEIAWADLREVWILTTDEGPFVDDLYFGLVGRDGKGVAVPQGLATQHDLLAHLQKLPGFDNTAVVQAMGSTVNQRFLVWRASTSPSVTG
jgi:hypothetical protein